MWHEARKQEKKIRGIMIDHKRRAERRREFYESIRLDPAFYLQIHGQQMKIHIDAAISQAADSSLMPWMGDETNLIDRFDVRAHLDYIPTSSDVHPNNHHSEEGLLTEDQECQLNYERYRPLVQNDFQDNDEQTVLQRIYLKERCVDQNNPKSKNEVKKKLAEKKAAIGYNYEDSASKHNRSDEESDSSDGDDEEEFVDLDTTVNAESLDPDKLHRLNTIAKKFGIKKGLFTKFLESDKFESDKMKIAKEIESEKSLFAGRKSRRERRELFHQRMLILRSMNTDGTSLDHFGGEAGVAKPKEMKESDSSEDDDEASNGPVEEGKIEFITSFGGDSGEDDEEKEARRRLKKLEKKRQEEKKKEVKKKIKQLKNDEGAFTSAAVIYGPTLPSTADKQALGGKDIHFVGSNSQRKRHYRYQNSDREDNSPARRIRRSPSVRRDRRSSEDSDYAERRKRRRSRSRSRSRRRSPVYRPRSGRRSRSRSRNRRRIRRRSSSSGSRSRSRSRSRRRSRRSRSVDRRRRSRSRSYRRSSYRDRRRRSRSRSHNRRSKRDSSNEDSSRKRFQSRNSNKSSSPTRSKLLNRNLELKKELEPLVSVSNEESSKAESKVDDSVMPPLPPTPDVSITIAPASPIQDNSVATIPEVEVEVTPPPLPIEALVPPPPPPPEVELPPPPVKRYYRHDLASDSEELSDDEPSTPRKSIDSGEPRLTGLSNTGVSSAGATSTQTKPMLPASNSKGVTPITPQERIRRLMQAQLDKQFKLDKKAEEDKLEKKRLEQIERDKLASKIESKRRRGRSRSASSSDSLHSKSRSSSRSPPRGKRSRRSRSRSRGRRFRRSRSNSRRHSRRRRDRSSS